MSFFTVEEIQKPVYETYADGKYKTEILDMEKKHNNFDGEYIEIQRLFLDSEYEGKVWVKKYKIYSDSKSVRHIARQDISKLAVNIAKIQVGEELKPEHVIGKITEILVRNKTNPNGNTFCNIEREELIDDGMSKETAESIINNHQINGIAGSGMQPVPPTTLPNDAFNDLVPF